MKRSILSMLALSLFCLASLYSADAPPGQMFPSTVSFTYNEQAYNLYKTGESTRKKFLVKVYNVAHYLQEGAKITGETFQSILTDNRAKQLTLKWDRTVSADKVQEGYHESFQKTLSDTEQTQLKSQIETYIGFFNREVQKGEEHILRWIPGGHVEVSINGNIVGTISNQEFAKHLWEIWLGKNSVVDRNSLVSSLKR